MAYKILLAEDDKLLRNELKILLENALYQVVAPDTFSRIPQTVHSEKADLVLLDINLQDCSGFDICTQIRSETDVPVIFLTGRCSSADELAGMLKALTTTSPNPLNPPFCWQGSQQY